MNAFIPRVSTYLQFEWWEVYEAVYILTKWPPCVHAYGIPFQLLDKIGNRGAIYGWGGPERFNPKKLGKEFGMVFAELKKAIKNGEIRVVLNR